jgi:hypothetical protein
LRTGLGSNPLLGYPNTKGVKDQYHSGFLRLESNMNQSDIDNAKEKLAAINVDILRIKMQLDDANLAESEGRPINKEWYGKAIRAKKLKVIQQAKLQSQLCRNNTKLKHDKSFKDYFILAASEKLSGDEFAVLHKLATNIMLSDARK